MRAYCALHPPVGSKHRKDNKISEAILGKESTTKVDFTSVASVLEAREREIVRFPPNPEENWGPKRRAGKLLKEEEKEDDDHNMEVEEETDATRKRRKDESEQS